MATEGTKRAVRLGVESGPAFKVEAVGRARAAWTDFYHFVLSRRWREFFAMVSATFLGVNVLFAFAYTAMPGSVANARPGSFEDAFYFSVQTMATIGYGGMYPVTRAAHLLVVLEALIGLLSTAVITGLTFAKFARPTAKVLFAEKLTITPRNGVPHLTIRMANWRHNQVSEAQLRVVLLVDERTEEGESLRVPIPVPLVRASTTLFAMTWTAIHKIDESSPFFGEGALERLKAQRAELYLSFTGMDETLAQTITARKRYTLDAIIPGHRYVDVVTIKEDGTRVIDYTHFHETIPVTSKPPPSRDASSPL